MRFYARSNQPIAEPLRQGATLDGPAIDSLAIGDGGWRIEICERRDALSASLVGAGLVSLIEQVIGPPSGLDGSCPAVFAPETIEPVVLPQTMVPAPQSFSSATGPAPLLDQAALVGARGLDGRGQTIAVIDSGIAYDHPALGGGLGSNYRVVGGWDFAENDADPYDDAPAGFHGSHVAGLIAGSGSLPSGGSFQGVAPGADLVGLRVFDDFGGSNLSWIESALRWVHDNQNQFENPITTVNLSIGTALTDANREAAMTMLEDELQLLREDNILIFAATGNGFASLASSSSSTADATLYPASSPFVTGVGAVDFAGNLTGFSQREEDIFVAPGQVIRSTVPQHVFGFDGDPNDFAVLSGTSMASPQVAAASAVVRQAMSEAGLQPTADLILSRLRETAVPRIDDVTGIRYFQLDLDAATTFDVAPDDSPGGDVIDGAVPTVPVLTEYRGISGSDALTLDLRSFNGGTSPTSWIRLTDGSGEHELRFSAADSGSSSPLLIDAIDGADTLTIHGSDQLERLTLRPPSLGESSRLVFAGGEIELRGFENVIFIGGGGGDRAMLYDSPQDDTYQSGGDEVRLTGPGFAFEVQNVPNLYVHATAGGDDSAHLRDSTGDDALVIRQQFSSMRGSDRFQAAFGFERVYAYSESGGHDRADLGDSTGDDTMSISRSRSLISSLGYRATVIGFTDVSATASLGGNDTVRMFVDDPNGVWMTTDTLTQWSGDGVTRIARGFDRAETVEQFASPPPVTTQAIPQITGSRDEMIAAMQTLMERLAAADPLIG